LSLIAADVRHGDRCIVHLSGEDEQVANAALRNFVRDILPHSDAALEHTIAQAQKMPRVLQAAGLNAYFGVPASSGVAHGKVVVLRAMSLPAGLAAQSARDPREELRRVKLAIDAVRDRIRERLSQGSSPTGQAVLQADLAMANDILFADRIAEQVAKGKSAGHAVVETGEFFINLLRRSDSEYIRERASDVEEISVQVLDEIYGADVRSTVLSLQNPSIVVAESLGPQQLLALDRRHLKGVVLEHSGASSHALILARSHGIPAVAGIKSARLLLKPGQEILVDGNRGFVLPHYSQAAERFYVREHSTLQKQRRSLAKDIAGPAITKDGTTMEVAANASSPDDLRRAFENGADGIGLFRTEINFLERERPPSEEEQFELYSEAARLSGNRPVIIRTFDLGADKSTPYLNLPAEKNPFLGYRGVRIYAAHRDLLQAQLRAILRASVHGGIRIMAPMISSLEEVLDFKNEVVKAKQELERSNVPFQRDVPVGVMVEVPSAAFIVSELCREVDFLSIGTNDLAQYFFAVDRDNARIAELSNELHPGFLRIVKQIVDAARADGKWIGMCGEMASNPSYLPVLLGLGLSEISVSAGKIPEIKRTVRNLNALACQSLLAQMMASRDAAAARALLVSAQLAGSRPLLGEDLVVLDSESNNKEEAIQELVDSLYLDGRTHDRQRLEDALWARETLYSTGLGFGFATPHCKSDAISADSIGVLRPRSPINWGSVDGQPVRMVILIAMREQQPTNGHMQVFSRLARKLMNEDFRESLLSLVTAPELIEFLAQQLEIPSH